MRRAMKFVADVLTGIRRNNSGATSTFIAAAAIPLVAFTGLAIDTARGYFVKARLNYALDSAALAGGKVMFDTAARDAAIDKFFTANFPDGYMNSTVTGPTLTVNTEDQTIKLDASVEMETSLMKVVGIDTVGVAASSEVQRQIKGMELALVLDNTGSMRHTAPSSSQPKIDDLKDAALQLTNILYAGREEVDDFYVAIVPYTSMVNVGNQHASWLTGYNPAAYNPTVWKGCVEARHTGIRDRNDDPPSVEAFVPAYWPQTATSLDWPPVVETNESNARGPNANCAAAIQPLIKAKTDVDDVLEAMTYWRHGGTMGNQGLVWGWRVLSPRWRGLWDGDDPTDLPKDYIADLVANNEELSDKAVIVMTDGQNNIVSNHYSAYGMRQWARLGSTNGNTIANEINARMLETCDQMKDEGIIIYTITFDTEGTSNQAVRDTYRNCATTDDHYFNSPGEQELTAAFIAIGTQLSNLRIAK